MVFELNDKCKMYYEVHGNANSGKTIVFLNGLSQSTIAWGGFLPSFIPDYQVILIDQILQGQSDKNSGVRDFDKHASDVFELLQYLNKTKVILCGISYGSLIAQNFAVNYPEMVSKLILMSTFAHKTPYFEAIETSWNRALEMGGYQLLLDVMLPQVLGQNYFEHPLIPISQLKEQRKGTAPDPESLKKLMTATKNRTDYRAKLKQIDTPTLVIQGQIDLLVQVQMGKAVSDSIIGSKFVIIPNAGHTLNLEAIPQTVKIIHDWLKLN